MAGVMNFFGYYRVIPEENYTFYSYEASAFITKKKPVANRRTLGVLKDFMGYLLAGVDPDGFEPSFTKPLGYY